MKTNQKKSTSLPVQLLFISILLLFVACKKDISSTNITLYNQPLQIIQQYTLGKWKLAYTIGGICGAKEFPTHKTYMELTSNNVKIGNDAVGVFINSSIKWVKVNLDQKNSTFLLSFTSPSQNYFVDQIKNDTLIIRDFYISDGYTYYYAKY